jgi:hypothetical protein
MRSVLMGRARCEWYKSIDVRDWHRQGVLTPPGKVFVCNWTSNGKPSGSISVFVRDGSVTLGYRLGQGGQPIEQRLSGNSKPDQSPPNRVRIFRAFI